MPDHPKPEKKKSASSSEDIQVPPIPKQTAGAVTGAAIGSIAGPAGAVVGGVIGAVVGKLRPAGGQFGRLLDAPRQSRKAHSNETRQKSLCLSREKAPGGGYAPRVRKGRDLGNRHRRVRGRNAVAVARKGVKRLSRLLARKHRLPCWNPS